MTAWGFLPFDAKGGLQKEPMNKSEVRNHVEAELARRGIEDPHKISNKNACKLLGLMPNNVKGIGSVNGGRMLRAWCEGRPVTFDQLGGIVVDQRPQLHRVQPGQLTNQSKKVARAKMRRRANLRKDFYESREWRETRYMALQLCGAKCQCCGRSRTDGVILHVDHIKPKSLFPELALVLNNLQVLCEDCNLGKSNKDQTDWRTADATA